MTLTRPPDWETAVPFTGASGTGLPGPSAPLPFPHLPALEPPPPQRRPDCAIWVPLPHGRGFGLLCGADRWRRHADPEAAHAACYFDALRYSALQAGWRPDANGVWNCPRCKMRPGYASPQPVAHYGAELDVIWRTAGQDPVAEFWAWARDRHAAIWGVTS